MGSRKYAAPETAAVAGGWSLWQGLMHSAAVCACAYLLWESKMLSRPETKRLSIFPSSFAIISLKRKDAGMRGVGEIPVNESSFLSDLLHIAACS